MADRDAVLRELAALTAAALRCSPAGLEPPAGSVLDGLGVSPGDPPETVEAALRAALGMVCPLPAGRAAPLDVVDLTEPGGSPRDAEVLTEAGVVRVSTGQVTAHSGQPVVVVEVYPNTRWRARTHPGGHWNAVTRFRGGRTEVVLTRSAKGDSGG